ncbi:MAG: hypothetical protein V2A65_00650 [Candidatus Omnitrophota bacterium]
MRKLLNFVKEKEKGKQRWVLRLNLLFLFLIVVIFLLVYLRDRQAWKGVKTEPAAPGGKEQSLPPAPPKSAGKRLPFQFVVPEEQKEKVEKIPPAPEGFENYERERRQEEKNPGTPVG